MQGKERAKYGAEIIKKLAKELSAEYGKGFTKSRELLSWSHYAVLLQVDDEKARAWYEKEATEQTWSVRTLQRNVSSQYYYRMLQTQKREIVEEEMRELTSEYQSDKL